MAELSQYLLDRGFNNTQANTAAANNEAKLRAWRSQEITTGQCVDIWQLVLQFGNLNNVGGIDNLASMIGAPIDKTQEAYEHIVTFIDDWLAENPE